MKRSSHVSEDLKLVFCSSDSLYSIKSKDLIKSPKYVNHKENDCLVYVARILNVNVFITAFYEDICA